MTKLAYMGCFLIATVAAIVTITAGLVAGLVTIPICVFVAFVGMIMENIKKGNS